MAEKAVTEISFCLAWQNSEPVLAGHAMTFWDQIGLVMKTEEIEKCASELCALAYTEGRVMAVSTAHLFDFPRLRSRFFYYQTTVSADFRRQHLASRLCSYSRDRLAEWSKEHPEDKMQGPFIVIQAEEFKRRQHVPIATQDDLKPVRVGYTPSGHQLRIIRFHDASVG